MSSRSKIALIILAFIAIVVVITSIGGTIKVSHMEKVVDVCLLENRHLPNPKQFCQDKYKLGE